MAVDGVTKEKKRKKKIKVEETDGVVQDAGNANVMQCHNVSVQTGVKTEPLAINARGGENEEKKKKKKKKLKEEVEATGCHDVSVQTSVKVERSEVHISDAPEKTTKKKKRKTKEEPEPLREEEDGGHLEKKKKKAKKKGYEDEVEDKKEVEVKEEEVDLGHSVETMKKKKKKKKERELNTELEDGEKKRKKKEVDECIEEEQKVKKKKKPSAKEEPDVVISSNDKPEKKSKRQKRDLKSEDEDESRPHANGGHASSPEKMKKKKKKKKDKVEAEDVIEKMEPVGKKDRKEEWNQTPEKVKKKKIKEERCDALKESKATDIVFLSAKPGNQDEISIDQARRLALQRDVDKESQPKPTLGQWETAQFDSPDRQAKFLRLMGGFKKSSQPATGSSGSANKALGKEGQQTLQQGLLGEFERAQSRRMDFNNKGAGLGFAAPSNKKFTINVNARNSVRFDD